MLRIEGSYAIPPYLTAAFLWIQNTSDLQCSCEFSTLGLLIPIPLCTTITHLNLISYAKALEAWKAKCRSIETLLRTARSCVVARVRFNHSSLIKLFRSNYILINVMNGVRPNSIFQHFYNWFNVNRHDVKHHHEHPLKFTSFCSRLHTSLQSIMAFGVVIIIPTLKSNHHCFCVT